MDRIGREAAENQWVVEDEDVPMKVEVGQHQVLMDGMGKMVVENSVE